MQPIAFKVAKPLQFEEKAKDYILKNYDSTALTDEVKAFLKEFQQNRNVVMNLGEIAKDPGSIKANIPVLIGYLRQIDLLKKKMSFGKESHCLKVNFEWTDIFKKSYHSSHSIDFEYCNNLFNLGVMYYLVASTLQRENPQTENQDLLSQITKNYQYSMGIFELTKKEVEKISQKERPDDLAPRYLDYCILLGSAYGQMELIHISEIKKAKFELQTKLCLGVSGLFQDAYYLAANEQVVSKTVDSSFKQYLQNRSIYYESLMYFKYADLYLEKYNKVGEGYGDSLTYQGKAVELLMKCYENAKSIPKLINLESLNQKIKKETEKGEEMYDKNERVIHSPTPDLKGMMFERKIMVVEKVPPEFSEELKKNETSSSSELDSLIPREVREMMMRYKDKMMTEITNTLNENENEDTVKSFINSLNIPLPMDGAQLLSNDTSGIDNFLWAKIVKIQQLGGTVFLSNTIQNIIQRSSELESKLNEALNSIAREEKEDMQYRNKYGDIKWVRKPSSSLNNNLIMNIKKFIATLTKTRTFDLKEKEDIVSNAKYFEILSLSRENLNAKIPVKILKKKEPPKKAKEEISLQKEMAELNELSKKSMEIINSIFSMLNQDSLSTAAFMEVLSSKTTEQAYFDKRKAEFDKKFAELASLSKEIRDKKVIVSQLADQVKALMAPDQSEGDAPEAAQFKKQLNGYVDLYMSKYEKLNKGSAYYSGLTNNIMAVLKEAFEFLKHRNEERNNLLASITSFPQSVGMNREQINKYKYEDEGAYYDASKNQITNMNVVDYRLNNSQQQRYSQQGFNQQQGYNPQGFNQQQGYNPQQAYTQQNIYQQQGFNQQQNFTQQQNFSQQSFYQQNYNPQKGFSQFNPSQLKYNQDNSGFNH